MVQAEPTATQPAELTVFAAAGLTEVMQDMQAAFQQDHRCTVRLCLAASSTLARQIESGAPADVFVSADRQWVDYLDERQLLEPGSPRVLCSNRLVIVAPTDSAAVRLPASLQDWVAADVPEHGAIPDPSHVPAGRYAREALETAGLWQAAEARIVLNESVRATLRRVEVGEATWGVVYATDAKASSRVRVVSEIPPHLHRPIVVSAAAVRRATPTDRAALARQFMSYLHEPAATSQFARRGFLPPPSSSNADRHPPGVPGVASYSSTQIRRIVALSMKVAVLSTALLLPPGLLIGWVLARARFPGKSVLDALVHAPLVMPPVLTGYLLLLVLGRNGIAGRWLGDHLGVNLSFTWIGAALAASVMGLPLLVRSVRLAIEMIDRRLEQSAATLGAGRARVWFTITLPLTLPGLIAGLVLSLARSLGEFGATMTFAGNVEDQTRTLPLAIYSLMQQPGSEAAVRHLAIISLGLSFGALIVSEWFTRRTRRAVGAVC